MANSAIKQHHNVAVDISRAIMSTLSTATAINFSLWHVSSALESFQYKLVFSGKQLQETVTEELVFMCRVMTSVAELELQTLRMWSNVDKMLFTDSTSRLNEQKLVSP